MDLEALGRSPVGRLVPISGSDFSYFAFVPDDLPAEVQLAPATVAAISEAGIALGRLDRATDQLPNPMLLVRPTLSKEAVSTSALEGTFAPLEDVLEGELSGDPRSLSGSTREVLNYVAAARRALDVLPTQPVSLRLIKELQRTLVQGTRGDTSDAGELRNRQVMIGAEHRPVEEARFVPPPKHLLPAAVHAWEKWIQDERNALLVRVALGHYQFETIHPFSDGNGRIGRLLVVLQLIEGRYLRYPLLNISEWLAPRRAEYQARLLEVSITGDHDSWITFFCKGIAEQSDRAAQRITRLLALRESFAAQVRAVPGSRGGTALRIAEDLIGYPMLDIPTISRWHDVSYPAAKAAVHKLVDLGLLRQLPRRSHPKVFVCDGVMLELNR